MTDVLAPATAQARACFDSPLGPLHAAASALGVVRLGFFPTPDDPADGGTPADAAQQQLTQLQHELDEYWRGRRQRFDIALDLRGTPFQRAVWRALQRLDRGQTTHYAALAQQLGRPQAARAIGAAVGRNPVAIVVPCHRVLGRDGSLTGFAWGLDRKRALLALEAAGSAS